MTLDLASSFRKRYPIKKGYLLCYALATVTAWLAGCASTLGGEDISIDNPQRDGSTPGLRKILPPDGSTSASRASQKNEIDKLLEGIPDDAKGSNSEISIPVGDGSAPGRAEDEHQRKRRESKNRRTDNEIVGAARTIDERHAKDMGELDRDLGLTPSEKSESSPSYISTMQEIKALYKDREYEAALVETNEALRSFPKSAKLLTMKGTLHQKLNNIELATAAYERAFAIEPTKKLEAQIEHLRSVLEERAALGKKLETRGQYNAESSAQVNSSSTDGEAPK